MRRLFLVVTAAALVLGCAPVTPPSDTQRLQALYVPMRDGVRIAIDVWLPEQLEPAQRVPTLMRMTRYWRAADVVDDALESDSNFATATTLGQAGYAYVIVDARGTGASFGTRAYETTEDEVRDYGEIVDWIISQPWSNGRVGAFGVSYDGTTAEMLLVNEHPAVKAVAPLYPDFNAFDHLVYPGGVFLSSFIDDWGEAVWRMDTNDICGLENVTAAACDQLRTRVRGVKPVDDDPGGALLAQAVAEHQTNVHVADAARAVEFRDDPFGEGGPRRVDLLSSPSAHREQIERSGAAIFTRVSWLDAATVNGALGRYNTFSNPQVVEIGAWSHGGGHDADPFRPPDAPPDPSTQEQRRRMLAFFDRFLKRGEEPSSLAPSITYKTLGTDRWTTTEVWPPAGFTTDTYYLQGNGSLSLTAPTGSTEADHFELDHSVSTGGRNRWHTQNGGGDVVYPDRRTEDAKLLTYSTSPLTHAVEITGHPLVTLYAASTANDGAVFVYLEDVAPDGRTTYITEGELRAVSRRVSDLDPPYQHYGPYRTFLRSDAEPLTPGSVAELTFDLWATSVAIEAGHRIRIAIAGADRDSFARYPSDASTATLTVARNRRHPSRIVLPTRPFGSDD